MSKNKKVLLGSHDYMVMKHRELVEKEATLTYKDKLRAYLSFSLAELEEMNHPLFDIIDKKFPDLPKHYTLDDVRMTKLFQNIIELGSTKGIELTYKMDGSMSDTERPIDYDAINKETEGIK
jgi:hypothetical protein